MILASNSAAQTIAVGQQLVLTTLRRSGCNEYLNNGTSGVNLRTGKTYIVMFSANVANTVAGPVQLAITLNGSALPETTMITTPAAVGDIMNVSTQTGFSTCFPSGGYTLAITNNGANPIVVQPNASLLVTSSN